MTGGYLRVERDGKFENIEIEYLTPDERDEIFGRDYKRILQWLNLTCDFICLMENKNWGRQ